MTTDTLSPLRGSCECSACSFEVLTSPKARFRCHCLICQAFNGKPFADVVAVRAKDIVLKNAGNISFKKYRPPPNFNRGVCRTCGKPVVEVAGVGAFKVMFIPASNFEPEAHLPPVRMDIFYHRRVLDMPDSLPKYTLFPERVGGRETDHEWFVKWRVDLFGCHPRDGLGAVRHLPCGIIGWFFGKIG